ncbi:MAG: energy-coupled thiamine transporter ThiT [Bacilli bacterium]|nr:energy-coupled thiamine transporter ThiT [Bacilli bacterium]
MKKNNEVFKLTFSAILLSLAIVLEIVCKMIPILKMPNGGGISLAMLPLIIVAYVFGLKYGIITGIAYGIIDCFVLDGYGFNVFSFFLDYILGFGAMGLAAIFRKKAIKGNNLYFILGFLVAVLVRWLFSGFSGVINANIWGYDAAFLEGIFGSNHSGTFWLYFYSFVYYNLPYLSASTIICIITGLAVKKQIFRYFNNEEIAPAE